VGTEFRVNTYTPNYQLGSSAAMDDDGDFVVAWTSYGQDGSSTGAFARRFSSTGAPGSEFRLNAPTAGDQRDPKLTMDGFGRLVVAWNAENKDGFEYAVVARQFSRTGASIGGEFVVNTATLYNQLEAAVAIDASGDFVVAWTSSRQDAFEPGDTGIFAQRFVVPALDVDGDGTAEPLTDGLLVLRHLFGFQGASLIAGAVDVVECTRCTAPSIEQYLTAIAPQLDIDGDGELTPLTDGLLVERWLFGFNGATLISNAVDLSDCTRCTSQAISTYLTPLGP
jgi:hypothetical protein